MMIFAYTVLFFFNDPATTEIYTLSLHDALPISVGVVRRGDHRGEIEAVPVDEQRRRGRGQHAAEQHLAAGRREDRKEHTSELQSRQYLVCRILLEKKTIRVRTSRNRPTPRRSHL